ncbi:MAG: GAF domain-containing protein [Anaerolineae bacterium]|nr:GAF domain-containing protein [Anaerolineae bacterium]
MLALYAGQAAVIIDNARLYRESQRRIEEAEGLRRIAQIASSALTPDAIFSQVIAETVRLLDAEKAVVMMVDEPRKLLRAEAASIFGVPPEEARRLRIELDAGGMDQSVFRTLHPFLSNHAATDTRLIPAYRPLVERYKIERIISAPLVIQDRGVGEVLVANRASGDFTESDVHLLSTIAMQCARRA